MRAAAFEFRHRFVIVTAIYFMGFGCYRLDHHNSAEAILSLIGQDSLLSIRLLIAFGALIIALGAMLRTWATAYLHSDVVHDTLLHSDRLVADGPYRHVRNPLYLGVFLMNFGMGLLASRLGFCVIFFGVLFFQLRLIFREEAQLLATQGDSYARYLKAFPRLWPSFVPRLPAGGRLPQWRQAFIGEAFIWAFAAATFSYALTLRLEITWGIIGVALAWYTILQVRLRGRGSTLETRSLDSLREYLALDKKH